MFGLNQDCKININVNINPYSVERDVEGIWRFMFQTSSWMWSHFCVAVDTDFLRRVNAIVGIRNSKLLPESLVKWFLCINNN